MIICISKTLLNYKPHKSLNENFEYGYPYSNALLQFCVKFEHCKPHKAARHPTLCDVIIGLEMAIDPPPHRGILYTMIIWNCII